jgi:hypothetical protein
MLDDHPKLNGLPSMITLLRRLGVISEALSYLTFVEVLKAMLNQPNSK